MRTWLTFALLSVVAVSDSMGATNGFFVPSFRGLPQSEAGYWELFTVPVGAPGNPADRAGATTGAVLTQLDTNAFLTGSGNIYNLSGVSEFALVDETPFTLGTVVLQARSLGSELDHASATLTYSNESGVHSLPATSRVELNRGNQPGLGATVSTVWQWDLRGLGVNAYTITFRAADASLSFDALTLDTWNQFAPLFTEPFAVSDTEPVIERWVYANNAAPCDRPAGATFGTFGDAAGVDTRHAQHFLGWNTPSLIPTNLGPTRYLVKRCRITLTINRGNLFAYDPTPDDFQTFFETNHPAHVVDTDAGRPMELFGAGFRHGYDAASFDQCALFGTNAPGQRNAYAAAWSTNGVLVDISNNVGKTNAAYPQFEVAAFAVGTTTNVAAGELVPPGAKIAFELNLADPLVLAYVQQGLNEGRLRFMLSSLHVTAGQFGAPAYPDFATRFNEAVFEPTRLELEGSVVGSGDIDTDGLPDDWEAQTFGTLTHNGANDTDNDGASNLREFGAGTDPLDYRSVLRIEGFVPNGNIRPVLQYQHAASRRYALEFTEDFQRWTVVSNAPTYLLGTGQALWVDETATAGARFYRLRVN